MPRRSPRRAGELAAACGALFYTCEERALRHRGDCGCPLAVGAARVRPSRSAWYWDLRAYGGELVAAVTWALHASTVKVETPFFASWR